MAPFCELHRCYYYGARCIKCDFELDSWAAVVRRTMYREAMIDLAMHADIELHPVFSLNNGLILASSLVERKLEGPRLMSVLRPI